MTNEENRKIFALADHAVDEIDLALGNEFELDARNRVEQILLKTVAQAIREAQIEAYEETAKDACWYCRCTVNEAKRDGSGNWIHYDATEINTAGCAASGIRERLHALRDSLVPVEEKV